MYHHTIDPMKFQHVYVFPCRDQMASGLERARQVSNGLVRSDVHLSARECDEVTKILADNHSKRLKFPCTKNHLPSGQKKTRNKPLSVTQCEAFWLRNHLASEILNRHSDGNIIREYLVPTQARTRAGQQGTDGGSSIKGIRGGT